MSPALAFNTAVSFTTNTNWQNYAGGATLGHVALATGLAFLAVCSRCGRSCRRVAPVAMA
jgi:K+-transporting ATPase ATPase A chain